MDSNSNEWPLSRGLNFVVNYIRDNQILNTGIQIIWALIQLWISTWAILWCSVFGYIIFYNLYMPSVFTTKTVYIQYDSMCDMKSTPNVCRIPFASIALTQGRSPEFHRGQSYQFKIELNLPESEVNWNQGMFMVRLKLRDQKGNVVLNVAKPTGLKYKSYALRGVFLLLYWPLYVVGLTDETQHITVNLIDDFIEGSVHKVGPTVEAVIEFEARDIQVYPPTVLKISAALSGLRYFMYYWPLTSFAMGTTTFCFVLYIMTLIGFTKWYRNIQINNRIDYQNEDNNEENEVIFDANNEEIEDLLNNEINGEVDEQIEKDLFEEQVSQSEQIDNLLDGLSGDLSANESEASSTVVIPEAEDSERQSDDSQPIPDSSVG